MCKASEKFGQDPHGLLNRDSRKARGSASFLQHLSDLAVGQLPVLIIEVLELGGRALRVEEISAPGITGGVKS
jgi:hypothetical protein